MRIHRLLAAMAAMTLCAPVASFEGSAVEAAGQVAGGSQPYKSPLQKIEEQAKLENPSDGNSVHALVDEIFNYPHSFGQIPGVMDTIVRERLTKAEMNYKLGLSPGVEVADIVRFLNMLADKFQLPDYARTTPHQAEVISFGFEISAPTFMGVKSPQPADETAQVDSRKLSPAQATHILLVLIDQKLLNPDYQLPPDEWEKTQYGPAMERLRKYKELKESGQLAKVETRGVLISSISKTPDLRVTISRTVSQMSLTDGLDLVDQAFVSVGIGK